MSDTPFDAFDLTQEAFLRLTEHGHRLRDVRKIKAWLLTTVYREFLRGRRRDARYSMTTLEDLESELTEASPYVAEQRDGATVLQALVELDEVFRAPVALFYLEDYSYAEIGEILGIPVGTVMSRLSRGKARLQRALTQLARPNEAPNVIRFPSQAA
jgi:RNA polymerase sigma-70 factor (ECF subfamily)